MLASLDRDSYSAKNFSGPPLSVSSTPLFLSRVSAAFFWRLASLKVASNLTTKSAHVPTTRAPAAFPLPVLLEVVVVGWVLGFDFFEHVQGPFDPFPNFVGGCWPPSVMPWYFLEGPKNVPLIC